jgi:SAM-dependent methyltransferase
MGWSSDQLSPLSHAFVEFCRQQPALPVLDLGAGYGAATRAALAVGATVIANDLDLAHLDALEPHPALTLLSGRFPRQLSFQPASLGAIHAANIFHFLPPRQLEEGLRSIARWLAPGGRLFVLAATPFQAPFAAFLPEYERRIQAGVRWPGWVEKIGRYSTHRKLGQMPASIHLLDAPVLARSVTEAGLWVESVELCCRPDLPLQLRLDGRETVALVASR